MKGMNYAAVVDSYFSDFHCTAVSGTCSDSHAVGGGMGITRMAHSSFGQLPGSRGRSRHVRRRVGLPLLRRTSKIRRNHFFKPWQWMKGNPNFVGGPTGDAFVVKNHLELKNAIRVLVEANLMENVWGGFSQTDTAFLLTPKNQHTRNGTNVCPSGQVTDVTIVTRTSPTPEGELHLRPRFQEMARMERRRWQELAGAFMTLSWMTSTATMWVAARCLNCRTAGS